MERMKFIKRLDDDYRYRIEEQREAGLLEEDGKVIWDQSLKQKFIEIERK